MMIVCPSCHHKEIFGTLFCSECGAQLAQLEVSPARNTVHEREPNGQEGLHPSQSFKVPQLSTDLSLRILESERVLPLWGQEEYTLGRASGNQPVLPDVDLTPFQAYEAGVSRLHATIKIKDKIITVTDLGSSNGTRVNGKKITSHTPSRIEPGDILTLGNLKVQVFIQS